MVGEFESSFDLYIEAANRLLVETVEYQGISSEANEPETSVTQSAVNSSSN